MIAYIALGSNLHDPKMQLQRALDAITQMPQTQVLKTSRMYCSAPIGLIDQPDFLNQVLSIETQLLPHQLLQALQSIENQMGRVRDRHWGPRVIDCDILLYGQQVICAKDLMVPHPRMHERAFVLLPLAEIAPDLVLPSGQAISDLCKLVSNQLISIHETVQ